MKSKLNKYRQYTISDYLLNTDKFKEYLQFCEKNNLIKEKKYIMENLFRTLQLKENCGNEKLLSELKRLCVLLIIFSDFEIELLFDLEYFNPDIQKKVFNEIQNYFNIYDNNNEEMKIYISYKYYFWLLKLQNQNFVSRNEFKINSTLEKEVKESIEKLINYINIEKYIFNEKKKNEKLLILKIIYELSLYFYFKDEIENAFKYLKALINYYNEYIDTYKIQINSKEYNYFYFDIDKVKYFYKYLEKNIGQNNDTSNNKSLVEENKQPKNDIDNINIFNMDDITHYDQIINEDYQKYKNEIDKTNIDYLEKLSLSNENALNACDLNNKNNINSLLNCLKVNEFLIDTSLENFNYHTISKNFNDALKSKTELKITNNTNKKDDNDLQYVLKEITYYDIMLQLIENMINNKEKLPKTFFKNLSEFITNNALTGDLKLCGLIHSNMINFSHNLKLLHSYFTSFIQFFKEKTADYKIEIIKQIEFITIIVKLLYIITEAKKKIAFPFDKENIIEIQQDLHIELINIFIYWLSSDNNSKDEDKKTESKKLIKNLKYNPSINIIYILIESIRNLEFLKILKVLVSNVLEFVVKKKHLNDDIENNSELYDYIYEKKPKLFKINYLLDGVIKNIKVIMDEQTYFINLKIKFLESPDRDKYIFENGTFNFYIKNLFKLINQIDEKIYKYESIQKINELNSNDNVKDLNEKISDIIKEDNKEIDYYDEILSNKKNRFLSSFYYIIELNELNCDKETEMAIVNGINYLQIYMSNFKIEYMKNDLMTDISKIKKSYENFKSLLNQDILYQLILCFIKQKRFLEGVILIQYSKKFDSEVAYKLLQYICEKNDFINIVNFKYIWKMVLFEYLSNFFYKNNNLDALAKIKSLIKRVSNHQFLKGHPIRKHFKITNFINFLDYFNNIKYNF